MTDDPMDTPPVDFRALDPTRDAAAFDRRVAQIRFASNRVMARRRATGGTPLGLMFRWRGRLAAALLLVTLVSAALMRTVAVDAGIESEPVASDEIADALGASSPMGELLLSTSASPADALLDGVSQ